MFTGIVQEVGKIKNISSENKGIKITIECERILDDVKIGDSIAVNGICLTVTGVGAKHFTADVMPETMMKTNLGDLMISEGVNLERALRLSDRLGGHIVSGHIDGIGLVKGKSQDKNAVWLNIEAPQEILKYIVMKGSIAIDGTSLTIAYIDEKCFKVSLVTHTVENTVLRNKKIGDVVNIECDMIGKYVEKLFPINKQKEKEKEEAVVVPKKELTLDFLRANGFA